MKCIAGNRMLWYALFARMGCPREVGSFRVEDMMPRLMKMVLLVRPDITDWASIEYVDENVILGHAVKWLPEYRLPQYKKDKVQRFKAKVED